MTPEDKSPGPTTEKTDEPASDHILLSWILMFVGFGVISVVAVLLTAAI